MTMAGHKHPSLWLAQKCMSVALRPMLYCSRDCVPSQLCIIREIICSTISSCAPPAQVGIPLPCDSHHLLCPEHHSSHIVGAHKCTNIEVWDDKLFYIITHTFSTDPSWDLLTCTCTADAATFKYAEMIHIVRDALVQVIAQYSTRREEAALSEQLQQVSPAVRVQLHKQPQAQAASKPSQPTHAAARSMRRGEMFD